MDEIKPTPRGTLSGMLADALAAVDSKLPRMASEIIGVPAMARTMDRVSYGEPLTTGSGMTTRPRADTMDALLGAAPIAQGMNALGRKAVPAMVRNALAPTSPGMAQRGAIVYHGSPHTFDKFDMGKIGTGEGAQAYGHGLYFAEAKEVGKDYAEVLASPRNRVTDKAGVYIEPSPMGDGTYRLGTRSELGKPTGTIGDATQGLTDYQFPSIAAAVKHAKRNGMLPREGRPNLNMIGEDGKYVPIRRAADVEDPQYQQFIASQPGNLYKVDLPDEHIAKMLDWDKPLSQQPELVGALEKVGIFSGRKTMGPLGDQWEAHVGPGGTLMNTNQTGGGLVGAFSSDSHSRALFSDDLRKAGIPGIRYLDGGSRGAGAGTSNYVVFDDKLPKILERNGKSLAEQLAEKLK
jgi:hypothetical protein